LVIKEKAIGCPCLYLTQVYVDYATVRNDTGLVSLVFSKTLSR
jgi:hypothetical protein